jgi:polyisoprenoid-binding protein YceI
MKTAASLIFAAAALAACAPPAPKNAETNTAAEAAAPAGPAVAEKVDLPAGAYTIDKSHAHLGFAVNHLGFSNYIAEFNDFDAKLQLDPADPGKASLEATVKTASLELPSPPPGFHKEITGPMWLDAAKFPTISFKSTAVEVTGAKTARITGDLTLHGVTKPVVLDATFNGGYKGHPMDPHARIGFSAKGSFKRSDFGVAFGVPAPGSTLGVSDQVDVTIETEFSGPALEPTTTTAQPGA